MDRYFWLSLILYVLPIAIVVRVAFLKIELSWLHFLTICAMLIILFSWHGIILYLLIETTVFRKSLGENLSWFFENWYFLYVDILLFLGFIALFLWRRR